MLVVIGVAERANVGGGGRVGEIGGGEEDVVLAELVAGVGGCGGGRRDGEGGEKSVGGRPSTVARIHERERNWDVYGGVGGQKRES